MESERKEVWKQLHEEYKIQANEKVKQGYSWGIVRTLGIAAAPITAVVAGIDFAARQGYSLEGPDEIALFAVGAFGTIYGLAYGINSLVRRTKKKKNKVTTEYEIKGFVQDDISEIINRHTDYETDVNELEDITPHIMYKYLGQYESVNHLVIREPERQQKLAIAASENRKQ